VSFPPYARYRTSGISWVDPAPAHWAVQRLKSLFRLMARPAGENEQIVTAFRDGQVTLRSLRREEGFTNAVKEIGYQAVRTGDLVIHAMDAFAGAIGVSDSDGKSTPVYSVCTALKGETFPQYYGYLLRYMALSGFINSLAKGIRERSTDFRWLDAGCVEVPVPTDEEQRVIVKFLDQETAKIDALIEEQRRLVALLKEKLQAVISHAVTKGLNPATSTKDSGTNWFYVIPEHWGVKKLGQICSIVRGGSPRPAGDLRFFNGSFTPWITVGEVTKDDERFLVSTESMLTEEGAGLSRTIKAGTLILTNSGATLGVPKILKIAGCANDGILAFLDLDPEVNKDYLYFFLSSITGALRERVKQGSGQPNLNTGIVGALPIPFPPRAEQDQLAEYLVKRLSTFGTLISGAEELISLLQERRSALISAAVTGKIDVRDYATREKAAAVGAL